MSIVQPDILFTKPFATGSTPSVLPPDSGSAGTGRANMEDGFPIITEQPIASGGVPPVRQDFNNLFNMITQYLFWTQSGGLFNWSATLDYAVPAMVYRSGKFYFSLASSGPGTVAGPVDPAADANDTYWEEIHASVVFDKLATARTISSDPTKTTGAAFDGSANISIGVAPSLTDGAESRTLPPVGAATALTTLLNTMRNCLKWLFARFDTSGNANSANRWTTARSVRINLASSAAASLNGTADITPGVTGVLPIASGGTGATTVDGIRSAIGISSTPGNAAPMPIGSNGLGQWTRIQSPSSSLVISIPAGGTWAFFYAPWSDNLDPATNLGDFGVGVTSGGNTMDKGTYGVVGFAWRIA